MKASNGEFDKMNKKTQIHFVKELSNNILARIVQQIRDGKTPENWDGHELRALVALGFEQSAAMSLVRTEPRSKRARDYKNTVIVNNLG